MHQVSDDLIDRIYEAAYIPDLWPSLLDALSARSGAWGGMLFTAVPDKTRWIASEATSGFFEQFIANGWMHKNPLIERGVARDYAGFMTDLDLFSPGELDAEPMYHDMRRLGGGWHVGTAVSVPNGDTLVINIERHYEQGPFDRKHAANLDLYRPHLCRAALIAARQSDLQMVATINNLEMLGLAAGALNSAGKLLATNSLFNQIMPDIIDDTPRRARITHKNSDDIFVDVMNNFSSGDSNRAGRSIAIPGSSTQPPSILHVVPFKGAARDIFARAACLAVVTKVELGTVPDAQLIRGLFDLTPAESEIARHIAKGMNAPEIATQHSVSQNTIKSQIKSVFEKTGVGKQSELSALLNGFLVLKK